MSELYAALQAFGIQASLSERGRPEERITSGCGKSLGVIDVNGSPISWVNIKKSVLTGHEVTDSNAEFWSIEYGVPDSKIAPAFPKFPKVRIKTTRVKAFPLFGEVVSLRWKGKDFSLGIIDYLNGDVSLHRPIIVSCDLEIGAYPGHSCWILTARTWEADESWLGGGFRGTFIPSQQLWDCLQSIARHLLAKTLPPNT